MKGTGNKGPLASAVPCSCSGYHKASRWELKTCSARLPNASMTAARAEMVRPRPKFRGQDSCAFCLNVTQVGKVSQLFSVQLLLLGV